MIKSYRVHGKGADKYDNVRIGINSRLDTLQAAVLLEKLAAFPDELVTRNSAAKYYETVLKDRYQTPKIPRGYLSSWAQYTLVSSDRDAVMADYRDKGVPCVIYYGTCMHQQTAFKVFRHCDSEFPIASRLAQQVFSLPMHGYLDVTKISQL